MILIETALHDFKFVPSGTSLSSVAVEGLCGAACGVASIGERVAICHHATPRWLPYGTTRSWAGVQMAVTVADTMRRPVDAVEWDRRATSRRVIVPTSKVYPSVASRATRVMKSNASRWARAGPTLCFTFTRLAVIMSRGYCFIPARSLSRSVG